MNTNLQANPFDLQQIDAYLAWRERKLATYPKCAEDLIIEIHDPSCLTDTERKEILIKCSQSNMAIYAMKPELAEDKHYIHLLGLQFGLQHLDHNPGADEDAVSAITTQDDAYHREYIPYTNKPIAWHTDGYYNTPHQQIQSFILHCVQPAVDGGYNQLLDQEILYIAVRDHNPDYIHALMHQQAMVIPANVVDNVEIRPASYGPVFSINRDGSLHLRYTDRTLSIVWRDDVVTQQAVTYIKNWLHSSNAPYRFEVRLATGQGLIANNVLHTRSAFIDGIKPRLLYRARYYDRIKI